MTAVTRLVTALDPCFAVLALALCAFGSILSMRLFARVRRNYGARRLHWLFLAGIVAVGTIWTTQFFIDLGYDPPAGRSFDPTLLGVSILLAAVFTYSGFHITARAKLGPMVECGGMVFGLGIGATHYAGVAAFHAPGSIRLDGALAFWSIAFGVFFGAVAMNRMARPVTRFCKYGGSLAMLLAVCLTHVTAMLATTFDPATHAVMTPPALSSGLLASGIAVAILLIMATSRSAYVIDLHAAREASDTYRHLASHDPLTGLPNRNHLSGTICEMLARNDDTARIAVLAFDLSRFKDVNDVHGQAAGDAVLRAIAARLSAALEPTEFLARVGGDEFVAVKRDIFARGEAMRFAKRLRALIGEPMEWKDQTLSVGCGIGIALFPEDGDAGDLLVSRADLAMCRAKSLGSNKIRAYEPAMDEASRSRAALAIDLRRAIGNDEFELYYQVQNDTSTREVVGFEALLRWNHPEKGRVPPLDFIPIAEETGLIIDIGDWVLRTACAAAARWDRPYKVAVNVSPLQLAQGDLPKRVAEILRETGLPPGRLEVEITESGIIADQQHALQVILALKALGVSVAMDDFGTGYSSLATLRNFPFDKIKIDKSFIDGLGANAQAAAIVIATILLGKSLRIPVLAEGVETEGHLTFLRDQGCSSVQGYLFGRPLPLDETSRLISADPAEATITRAAA